MKHYFLDSNQIPTISKLSPWATRLYILKTVPKSTQFQSDQQQFVETIYEQFPGTASVSATGREAISKSTLLPTVLDMFRKIPFMPYRDFLEMVGIWQESRK